MTTNTFFGDLEEYEEWLDSQDMNPAPDAGHVTTSPAMTTAAPSASAVGIANAALQHLGQGVEENTMELNQQLDALAQTFLVSPQFTGSLNSNWLQSTSPVGFSPGMNALRKQSSSSETKKEWSAVLKPVTSPVKGQLTASTTMLEAPTKPSRSSKKKAVAVGGHNVGQW